MSELEATRQMLKVAKEALEAMREQCAKCARPEALQIEKDFVTLGLILERVKSTLGHRCNSPWAQELLRWIDSQLPKTTPSPRGTK